MRKVIFISAPSGAGKTTVRKTLDETIASNFNNNIFKIEIDAMYKEINPNFRAKNHLEIWKKARENTGHLIKEKLDEGTEAIFVVGNTIFSDQRMQEVLKPIQAEDGVEFIHITLAPTRSELARRLKKRRGSVPKWIDSHLAEREPYLEAKWTNVIDNSKMTPEQTVTAIYEVIKYGRTMKSFFEDE
ncbi:AAA family ATPase [Bacillus suaedae]|uniref:AAA family ATPase n=1 Tax=Halalkalibacter suaedae TaxID=2822140 RepID=A0A941ANI8_9BACI|nr:AAA family ATPase [Bacillus suaedae]MBP3950876.1 AAA family ATPase [Bacillus suaedae]